MLIVDEGFEKALYSEGFRNHIVEIRKNNLLAIIVVSIPFQLFTCKFFGSCPSTTSLTTNVGEGLFWLNDGLKFM
jgi:hypothetical protein